jgi:glycosyltransferase involved in cell wall biosynthesis
MSAAARKVVFISWAEDCSRSDGIAARLGGQSKKVYSPFWGSRYLTIVFKYLSQTLQTLRVLRRERARVILVMTPPVVACLPVWLFCKITGARYAIDAHTGAFLDPRWQRLLFLHKFFSRQAVTTVVTNDHLANIVRGWGAQSTIVPDVPVVFPEPKEYPLRPGAPFHMTLVSSFTWDEPLELFIEAAKQTPEVHFYVTGKPPRERQTLVDGAPSNVTFTGFLPRSQYVGLLRQSHAVISLTTLDHTMQRAAYEAVYLGKPVITSNFALLLKEFDRGTVHVDNTAAAIAAGIRAMRTDVGRYTTEAAALREKKLNRWRQSETELRRLFDLVDEGVVGR